MYIGQVNKGEVKKGKYYFMFAYTDRGNDGYPKNLILVRVTSVVYHYQYGTRFNADYRVVQLHNGINIKCEVSSRNYGFYSANRAEIRDEKNRQKELVRKLVLMPPAHRSSQKGGKPEIIRRMTEVIDKF